MRFDYQAQPLLEFNVLSPGSVWPLIDIRRLIDTVQRHAEKPTSCKPQPPPTANLLRCPHPQNGMVLTGNSAGLSAQEGFAADASQAAFCKDDLAQPLAIVFQPNR